MALSGGVGERGEFMKGKEVGGNVIDRDYDRCRLTALVISKPGMVFSGKCFIL